jgi:hypothetical protein
MKKLWSDLPNAHHIDWVLASIKKNPEIWTVMWDVECDRAYHAAADLAYAAWVAKDLAAAAAVDAAWAAVRAAADAATDAADAAWDAADAAEAAPRGHGGLRRWAARDSLLALVAHDDCDQYLNMGYEKLKVYAVLSDKPQAVLLLPMAYVREKIKMP